MFEVPRFLECFEFCCEGFFFGRYSWDFLCFLECFLVGFLGLLVSPRVALCFLLIQGFLKVLGDLRLPCGSRPLMFLGALLFARISFVFC